MATTDTTRSQISSESLKSGAASHEQRVAFQRGLSPFAILGNIENCLYAHYRSAREWFLSMDVQRRGNISDKEFLDGIARLNVHPEVLCSNALATLLKSKKSRTPGCMSFDEFGHFMHQHLGIHDPSIAAISKGKEANYSNDVAVSVVRTGLNRLAMSFREMFLLVDDGRNGWITHDQFKRRLVQLGLPPNTVNSSEFQQALDQ